MWSEIARSVRGGKRFRSGLVLGAHSGLGGAYPDAAVAVAGGFELLHTAFLVHDDLIDGDTLHRGKPNLAETKRRDAVSDGLGEQAADRWATASAVLGGDLALALAHRLVAGVDAPARIRVALTELLDETVLVSAAGELLDTARVAAGALLLGTGWPGPLAAVLVLPYIGLAWPRRSVPEEEADRAHCGCQQFLVASYSVGFLVTMLLIAVALGS